MPPSVNDIARFRGPKAQTKPVLNAVPKNIVATARVNQASFTFPLVAITVDNTVGWSNIKVGYLFMIGTSPGSGDIMHGIVRAAPTSTVLYIDAKDLGDPGFPNNIIQPIANDYYVSIIKFRPPWGLLSSIRGGVFYKRWDVNYTNQLNRPDPICRFGGWRQAFIDDSTGTAILSFDCGDSFMWGGLAKAGQLWNVDGGTIIVNSATDEAIMVEFEPGFYEIECRVTDAVGKQHTGYRYVWVNTNTPDDEFSPFSYRHVVRISTDAQDLSGRKMTYEVDGDVTDELFPGQGFFFKEYPRFQVESGAWEELDDPEGYPFTYCGYRVDSGYKVSKNLKTTTINTEGPGVRAADIVSATQQIVESQVQNTWAQCSPILSNPVGAVWYSVYWHAPYLINGHDFLFDPYLLQLRKRSFQFASTQVGSQLQGIAEMFLGFVGWKSNGSMKMVRNPNYFTNAERNDLDTQWTWEPGDIKGQLEAMRSFKMQTGQVYGSAFSFDGSESVPYASLSPGYSKAQGGNTSSPTAFIVTKTQGQAKVNDYTGHQFALENRKDSDYSLEVMKNLDVVEPIDCDVWSILNVSAEYDPEGEGWLNKRSIVTRVTRSWSVGPQVEKTISIELQFETFGLPGITVPVDRGAGNTGGTNKWNPSITDPYEPKAPDIVGWEFDLVYAWNEYGQLARTESFTREEVQWERVTGYQGVMRDACLDPSSPFFDDEDDNLRGWFVTTEGTTIRIYYVQDLFALSLAFELEKTLTAGTGFNGKVRIATSNEPIDLAVVAWKDRTGVKFSRITTSAHNWSNAATVGSVVSDPDHDNDELGLSIKGETQAIIAPDGSINPGDGKYDYFLFAATTASGGFSQVPNAPSGERAILGCVQLQDDNNAVLGYEGPGSTPPTDPLSIVTFDAFGYTHYDIGLFNVGTVGPFPPAIYSAVNQFGNTGVGVTILFEGEYTFQEMEFLVGIEGSFGGSDFGPYQYYINVIGIKGYGTPNATVVGRKTFPAESPYYDPVNFKTEITNSDLMFGDTIDALYLNATISKPGLAPGIWYLYLDNIDITAQYVSRSSTRLTRKATMSGSWSDVTPADDVAPVTPYGIGMYGSKYSMIATTDNGYAKLYYSSSGGGGWITKGKTKAIGVKRADELCVFFGYNELSVSNDNGSTRYSRLGDWPYKMGKVGTIRGMMGLF